ncbi:MAG: ATP-binding protein [Deltaproteobacteria bacterium]|nr:ATP-binding protein [Deltaproteobacteria bacterium]
MVYNRLMPPPRQSFFLLGPRGTGKTTYARAAFPKARRVDLLDETLYQGYLAEIGRFHGELAALPPGSWVIVDEVQRLPQLLNEVHRLIEDRRLKFVLTGSSARKLRRGGVNLLAGRALGKTLHPFVPAELGGDFDLERVLAVGTLPIVWDSEASEDTLRAYVQTYLKEEIKAEALVQNLSGFARFLPVAGLCHGQLLSVSAIARDAEVSRTTVNGFFGILEDTLIGFKLPAFAGRLRVREKRHPKFYFVDPGLARAVKGARGAVQAEERGALFEGWLAETLRAYNDYRGLYDDIAYWSPAEAKRTEVDFVLTRGREVIAIECKSAPRISTGDLAGLAAIAALPAVKRRIAVYTGRTARRHDGIEILPVRDFIELLDRGRV